MKILLKKELNQDIDAKIAAIPSSSAGSTSGGSGASNTPT